MIEVKGTRAIQPKPDASDPLGLRKPIDGGNGAIAVLVTGIIGIALYLRSFLWFEPQAALAAEGPVPGGPEGERKAPAAPRDVRLAETPADAADPSQPEPVPEDPAETLTLPTVFGPFDLGVFAPVPVALPAGIPDTSAANSPLPPFEGIFGRISPTTPVDTPFVMPLALRKTPPNLRQTDEEDDADGEEDPNTDGTGGTTPLRNRAPRNSGPVYLGDVGSGATLAFALSHLLAQSSDPDSDPLSVAIGSAPSGSVEQRPSGWRYIADHEELGEVRITYQISDGTHSITQTAVLTVIENRFDGTDAADLLQGTEGRDRIMAFAGDDNIAGFAGRDVVHGGAGDDNIAGGAGRDTLFGEEGNDIIAGGADDDWISGGAGDDQLFGEAGNDEAHGDAGNDLVDGGEGQDTLTGGDGDDTVMAGAGDDLASGGAGADFLRSAAGADVMFGGAGDDQLFGEAGNDEAHGDAGNDLVDGGEGQDTLTGGDGDDTVMAGAGDDLAAGGEGADHLQGAGGADVMFGDAGVDQLFGDTGQDLLFGGTGADLLDGGADNDILTGDAGDDSLLGGDGDDLAAAGDGDDTVLGGAGHDRLDGGSGNDLLEGASGDDTLVGGAGEDTLNAGPGNDQIVVEAELATDLLNGGEGYDVLVSTTEAMGLDFDLIEGSVIGDLTGKDLFSDIEAFVGTAGDDTFLAAAGEATLTGNGGADHYQFVQGDAVERPTSAYHVTDFDMNDRVTFSNATSGLVVRRIQRDLETRIESFFEDYADRFGADEPRLRYFHEWTDEYHRTVVEVDFDRDLVTDLTMVLDGDHDLDVSRAGTGQGV